MQAAFRAQAYSVPAINVEPPRQRPAAEFVGLASRLLWSADRNLPPPTLEQHQHQTFRRRRPSPTPRRRPLQHLMMIKPCRPRSTRRMLWIEGPVPPGPLAAGLRRVALPDAGVARGVRRFWAFLFAFLAFIRIMVRGPRLS